MNLPLVLASPFFRVGSFGEAKMQRFVKSAVLAIVIFELVCIVPSNAIGQVVEWVGYQDDCGGQLLNGGAASFHDGNQWFGFLTPGPDDFAFFDDAFDPQNNGIPHTVHFGTFEVETQGVGCNDVTIPAADTEVERLRVANGAYTFQLDGQTLATRSVDIGRSGETTNASLEIRGQGTVEAQVISVGRNDTTVQAGVTSLDINGPLTNVKIVPDAPDASTFWNIFRGGSLTIGQGVTVSRESGSVGLSLLTVGGEASGNGIATEGEMIIDGISTSVSGFTEVDVNGFMQVRNGAHLEVEDSILVSSAENGTPGKFEITSGASVSTNLVFVHNNSAMDISGANTEVVATGQLNVGRFPDGESIDRVVLSDGARLQTAKDTSPTSSSGVIGSTAGDRGEVRVTGAGTQWIQEDGVLGVGFRGDGELLIDNGGRVESNFGSIGRLSGSTGLVIVDGVSSQWTATESVFVGGFDSGSAGTGELRLASGGTVRVGPAGVLQVWETGRLSGNGTIDGDVVLVGGTISPGASPGSISINGDLDADAESTLEIEVGGLSANAEHDLLTVSGDTDIAGTVSFSFIGGFAPQAGDRIRFLEVDGAVDIGTAEFVVENLAAGFRFDIKSVSNGFELVALTDGVLIPEPGSLSIISLGILGFAIPSHRWKHKMLMKPHLKDHSVGLV